MKRRIVYCKSCNQEIEWVVSHTVNLTGNRTSFVPVNPGLVQYDAVPDGTVLIDHYGNRYIKSEGLEGPNLGLRISHFSVCPGTRWKEQQK